MRTAARPYAPSNRNHVRATHIELIIGHALADRVEQLIQGANDHVYLEFFIFRSDDIGYRLADAAINAVRRGVRVCVVYDASGALLDSEGVFDWMADGGVEVHCFHPIFVWRRKWRWGRIWSRDHRKIVCIDGRVAIVGSGNIGEPSAYNYPDAYYDVSVAFQGPAVAEVEREFATVWNRSGEREVVPAAPTPISERGTLVQVLANREGLRRRLIEKAYIKAIHLAQHRFYLANAYFVPNRRIRRALCNAAKRGVDVRVMVPRIRWTHLVHLAGSMFFDTLLSAGVRVFEWEPSILHAKYAVADEHWALVGSYNFDALSLHRNLEIAVVFSDPAVPQEIASRFKMDLSHCHEIDAETWLTRPWYVRLLQRFASLFQNWL